MGEAESKKKVNFTLSPLKIKREDQSAIIGDSFLLVGDIFILFASGFTVALSDVLSDPSFASSGGWAQPIPLVPPSLGSTINSVSVMGFTWALAGIKNRAYDPSAILNPESALKCVLSVWVDYCSIQIIFSLFGAILQHNTVDGLSLLREVLCTLIFMSGWRLLNVR